MKKRMIRSRIKSRKKITSKSKSKSRIGQDRPDWS